MSSQTDLFESWRYDLSIHLWIISSSHKPTAASSDSTSQVKIGTPIQLALFSKVNILMFVTKALLHMNTASF